VRSSTAPATEKKKAPPARRFDTVLISESANAHSAFELSLRSKVTQEVRATGTKGNLSALRSQVQGGTYQMDALAVARHMLRMPEEG